MRLIDADAAIEAVVGCTNCGTEDVLRAYVTKHSLENGWTGGIVDALDAIEQLPSVQPDTTTHESIPAETIENYGDRTSGDCISRQQAIDALKSRKTAEQSSAGIMRNAVVDFCIGIVKKLPSAQPVAKKIGYAECANAMLKMWIDNVLTDGEYNRIMDKLNAHYDAERRQK